MTKVMQKHCDACGVPFKSDRARFCSRECRQGWSKGGKTYDEKRLEIISRINDKWINSSPKKRVRVDPTYANLTNY